jgi:hypothetical protein
MLNRNHPSRRTFLKSTFAAAVGASLATNALEAQSNGATTLFDGKTLDGWIQVQNSQISFNGDDIADLAALAKMLTQKTDPVSAFLSNQLDPAVKTQLAAYSPSTTDVTAVKSSLAKNLSAIIATTSLYDQTRFQKIELQPEAQKLLKQDPHGRNLARLNRLLMEDAYPTEFVKSVATGWIVKDGAMASTGAGRGVIYTVKDYSRFRLMFTMRHVSGSPDHQACVLIFCSRPLAGEIPLDALDGIQFQVPNGGHWDYRPGMHTSGGAEFTTVNKIHLDPSSWSRVEILADASKGTARMAVAQPPGSKAIEVLAFQDPAAGKTGPIAWQIHNAGLFDEYKDVIIEANPVNNDLISVG